MYRHVHKVILIILRLNSVRNAHQDVKNVHLNKHVHNVNRIHGYYSQLINVNPIITVHNQIVKYANIQVLIITQDAINALNHII